MIGTHAKSIHISGNITIIYQTQQHHLYCTEVEHVKIDGSQELPWGIAESAAELIIAAPSTIICLVFK